MKNMVVCITSWLFDSKQPSSAQTTKISKFFYFSAFSFSRSVFLCSPCFLCFQCFYCFLYVFTMFYVFIDVLIFIYKHLWNKLRNRDGVNNSLHPCGDSKYSGELRCKQFLTPWWNCRRKTLHAIPMGAQQDETLPDMENRCNARTCKQQLTPSAELWKCCEKSRCKQYLTPSPKFRLAPHHLHRWCARYAQDKGKTKQQR